jgi:hypothetical protein
MTTLVDPALDFLMARPSVQFSCDFPESRDRGPSLGQSLGGNFNAGANQPGNRMSLPGYDDLLAASRFVDQVRQVGRCFQNSHLLHTDTIAN